MKIKQVPFTIKEIDETGKFTGYASVFDVVDSDGDVIKQGAFKSSIDSGKRPKMLYQHRPDQLIGDFPIMQEDQQGLFVEGQLVLGVQQGREAYELMKAGVLDAMSVGFNVVEAAPNDSKGIDVHKLDLWEISLVTWGANPKALIHNVKSIRDFEGVLRDVGYSQQQAKALASGGYKALSGQRDDDSEILDAIKNLTSKIESYYHE